MSGGKYLPVEDTQDRSLPRMPPSYGATEGQGHGHGHGKIKEKIQQSALMEKLQHVKVGVLVAFVLFATIAFRSKHAEEHEMPVPGMEAYPLSSTHDLWLKQDFGKTHFRVWLSYGMHEDDKDTNYKVELTMYKSNLPDGCEGEDEMKNENLASVSFNLTSSDNQKVFTQTWWDLPVDSNWKPCLRVHADAIAEPIVVDVKILALPGAAKASTVLAGVVLMLVYVLIVTEMVHRTIAGILGSFLTLSLISLLQDRPSLMTIIGWIDFETISLLFGMMVMVGIFSNTGFFEYCAVWAYKFSKGNVLHLLFILCIFTAVVSAFLDNVTTMLLITPVTVRLCKVLDLDPRPVLIAEVLFSNIGGTATPVGDPPNVIIISSRLLRKADISFGEFTVHMTIGAVFATLIAIPLVRYMYRDTFTRKSHQVSVLENEIIVWRKTLHKLTLHTPEENKLRAIMAGHIESLESELVTHRSDEPGEVDVSQLEREYVIQDWTLFIHCSIILILVILLFFLHSMVEAMNLDLAWIALIGAFMMLVVAGKIDLDEILEKVEWGTLLFFAALFILMEGLGELGLINWIGNSTADLIATVPKDSQLTVAVLVLLWVSAIVSAFIDNIPYTTAMIPIIVSLSEQLDLPIRPLVWSLAFGTCLGGNGTLIGASANVVTAGLAEQYGYTITFNDFIRTGFPVMIATISTTTVYLLLAHSAFKWDVPSE